MKLIKENQIMKVHLAMPSSSRSLVDQEVRKEENSLRRRKQQDVGLKKLKRQLHASSSLSFPSLNATPSVKNSQYAGFTYKK